MATWRVINIIDGDTIRVSPRWEFKGKTGDIVKVFGYRTPMEPSQANASAKLQKLLLNKDVELINAREFTASSEALLCSVLLNGIDVSKYFPEYPI